jgi:D-3-phosphoglycerate dehydrogenase
MEPPFPKDHVLLKARHTVFTPHAAFASEEALYTRAQIVFDNIELWEKGIPQNVCS